MPMPAADMNRLADNLENHAGSIQLGKLANNGETKLLLGEAAKTIRSMAMTVAAAEREPRFYGSALRKLDDLLYQEWQISGYALHRDGKHGFITTGSFVGWGAAEQQLDKKPASDEPAGWLCQAPAGVWSSGRVEASNESVQNYRDQGYVCTPFYDRPQIAEPELVDLLQTALERSGVALDDWLNLYASELCDQKRVAEARDRVGGPGTIAYLAEVQAQNRQALAAAKAATAGSEEKGSDEAADLETRLLHRLVAALRGFSVDLIPMRDGKRINEPKRGFSVGRGRSIALAEIIELVREGLLENTDTREMPVDLAHEFAQTMPHNWPAVLDSRADAAYLNDTEGTRKLLRATAAYLRASQATQAIEATS